MAFAAGSIGARIVSRFLPGAATKGAAATTGDGTTAGEDSLSAVRRITGSGNAGPSLDSGAEDLLYRKGGSNPGSFKLRAGEEGLSFRDSLSNPLDGKQCPVFPPGADYVSVDPAKLPTGSVVRDNVPPGHVTVTGATPTQVKGAVTGKGTLPQ